MTVKETSPLIELVEGVESAETSLKAAESNSAMVSRLLLGLQVVVLVFFYIGTSYSEEEHKTKEYIIFRDILAMLLIGFGYLMTFLKSYGLGAVGLTMMLTAITMEVNIIVEWLMRFWFDDISPETDWPMTITMGALIDAEFSAATLLITFGALIGRASPLQMIIVAILEAVFYAFNKVFFTLGFIGAEDVGGTMTIHMFGAYFGLAVSYALGPPKDPFTPDADRVSDVFALIGTTILWMFWPSFVGATETGTSLYEYRCVLNTVLALVGSTVAAFYMSQKLCNGKFDPVHIANSTLAGGVAIGSSARLSIGPASAMLVGVIAGSVSVIGYVYSPYLESKFGIHDTCGVGNLHGWPSIVGGLFSIVAVAMDSDAAFLSHGAVSQMIRQFLGVVVTVVIAIATGYGTGAAVKPLKDEMTESYKDSVWWHAEYFEEVADAKEA